MQFTLTAELVHVVAHMMLHVQAITRVRQYGVLQIVRKIAY